jgi:ribose 5-phosphate isomerase B
MAEVRWIVGADHAGLSLKRHLVAVLRELGDEVDDVGTFDETAVDYPDRAIAVAERVARGEGRGLLVCGTGIGMAMTANRIAGVRAAVVTDAFTARASRAHNDANVMTCGARVIGPGVAEEALRAFRATAFEGGRHARRLARIAALDRAGKVED